MNRPPRQPDGAPAAPRQRSSAARARPQSLRELLDGRRESPALARLTDQARAHAQLLARVRETLGPPLDGAVCAVSVADAQTLVVVVHSAAWASHLRLAAPTLIAPLAQACGIACTRLKVRVRPGAAEGDG